VPLQRGAIVLADLTGYTQYLGGVELEHSSDVLGDLLGVVAGQLDAAGLRLTKLEGDCVFSAGDVEASSLRTAIESTYYAFRTRRRAVASATSCTCDACRRIDDLDLKVVVHRGEWVAHDVAGRRELTGSDVVLAHRLLKNAVEGTRAYALFTYAAGADAEGTTSHIESISDIGDVACTVLDLEASWQDMEAVRPALVGPDDAVVTVEASIVAPPALAFEALTDPAHQRRWRVGLTRYEATDVGGSRGVGTTAHCVHGRTVITHEIVEWRPPERYSYRERNPIGRMLWTVVVVASDGGSRVTMRGSLAGGARERLLFALARRTMRRKCQENLDALSGYVTALRE
jgi:uncharacterized protein YndB with AHSA1/START domain